MGFWPIAQTPKNSGNINIAGDDLNLLELESLRQHIALLSQQGHIFDATIADNLRLAKHDATLEELRHVCQQVNLLEFIEDLTQGFEMTRTFNPSSAGCPLRPTLPLTP